MRSFTIQAAASANPALLVGRLSARQGLVIPRRSYGSAGAGHRELPRANPGAVSREISSQVAQ
eukprot:scaffold311827_cov36-Prasinocladus_malaysianus.AAC.1